MRVQRTRKERHQTRKRVTTVRIIWISRIVRPMAGIYVPVGVHTLDWSTREQLLLPGLHKSLAGRIPCHVCS